MQVLAFVLYHVVTSLILEPTALKCFNVTLERLKTDPRITVRIGAADDIRAWGSNSESRVQRQQIPHQIYKDANGVEHTRVGWEHTRGVGGWVSGEMYGTQYMGTDGYMYAWHLHAVCKT